ncbi:hypothetical protein CBR_g4551 [Chara braunii]|uniref:Uncharacterized protein n=1 Tax=Chara braunii TaxID=69332 RepID=A0A388KI49_CHABU|nr:hypothetical protein CBR_g4551 [Chara braunii]|eukprot:GBG69719.1 hypothetical protein CBR_g4551 [Chara braunii]
MSLLASGNIGIRPLSKVAACRVEDVHRAGMGRVEGREADAGIVRMMRGKANCCVLRAAEDRNARGKNGVAEEGDPNGKMEDDDDDDWEKAADRFTGCEDPVPQKVCHDGDGELSSGQDDLKSFEEDGHISSWNGVRKSDNGAGCEFNPVQEKGKHPGELRDDARDQDVHQCKLVTREMCSDEGNCCGEDFKGKEDKTGVVLGKGPEVFAVSVTSGAKLAGRWDWGAIGEYESVMSGAMEKHRDRREQGVDWREEGRNERQEKLGKAAEVVKTLRVDTSPSMYGGTGCVQSENAVEKRTWANVISLVNKPVTKAEIREGLLLSEGNRRSYSRGTRQGLHKASGLRNCDGESDVPCRDEALRIAAVTRKKSFECMERVDGKMVMAGEVQEDSHASACFFDTPDRAPG